MMSLSNLTSLEHFEASRNARSPEECNLTARTNAGRPSLLSCNMLQVVGNPTTTAFPHHI